MSWLVLAGIIIVVEVGLLIIVNQQRRNIPWLITKKDELPTFNSQALRKFLDNSFDSHLGWVRKPSTNGTENGKKGIITFHIDSLGSRAYSNFKEPSIVAAFGDSYTFCRQVEDDETWEAQLSQQKGFGVLNFGVGNYGVDQALLRYEGMELPESVKIVIMGFVPETICRIQSYWKHYLEFGNTFAFKPRFILNSEGNLTLLNNLIRTEEDFANLNKKLPELQKADSFYEMKFKSYQFRFPYTFSLLRNPLKQSMLILACIIRSVFRSLGATFNKIENLPFTLVMKNNLRDAYKQYNNRKATKLFSSILMRFKSEADRRGHIPLILVMPQLLDLKLNKNKKAAYQDYFNEISEYIPVIDLTKKFNNDGFEKLYINDQYGGHLSVDGNRLVMEAISDWMKTNGAFK